MQVFEFKGDGWALLYDIKKGDAEPPWREGELAEKARKKEAQLAKEDSASREEAKIEAEKTYKVLRPGHLYVYSDYVDGYVEGYRKAREKFGPKGRQ